MDWIKGLTRKVAGYNIQEVNARSETSAQGNSIGRLTSRVDLVIMLLLATASRQSLYACSTSPVPSRVARLIQY